MPAQRHAKWRCMILGRATAVVAGLFRKTECHSLATTASRLRIVPGRLASRAHSCAVLLENLDRTTRKKILAPSRTTAIPDAYDQGVPYRNNPKGVVLMRPPIAAQRRVVLGQGGNA